MSRGRYEDMAARCEKAEQRADAAESELSALLRARTGLPQYRPPRKAHDAPPIGPEISRLIQGFSSPVIRDQLTREAQRGLEAGKHADEILTALQGTVEAVS